VLKLKKNNSGAKRLMNTFVVGAELLDVHGRTDMTKLVVAFRNFANAPKKRDGPYLYRFKLHVCAAAYSDGGTGYFAHGGGGGGVCGPN